MKRFYQKSKNIFLFLLIMLGLFTLWANKTITSQTAPYISNQAAELPDNYVALVLGTNKYLKGGRPNAYFDLRIDAASALYHEGKVKYFIVSGDNKRENYNEPEQMQQDLIAKGVPEANIYLDYAGFRTLDSIVRAQHIFDQNKIIVVSQKFHNERAVYLARQKGIDAYGYNARDVVLRSGFKTRIREIMAKNKVFYDLAFGVKPKFLGEKVEISKY